jgi:hypothetical protein
MLVHLIDTPEAKIAELDSKIETHLAALSGVPPTLHPAAV